MSDAERENGERAGMLERETHGKELLTWECDDGDRRGLPGQRLHRDVRWWVVREVRGVVGHGARVRCRGWVGMRLMRRCNRIANRPSGGGSDIAGRRQKIDIPAATCNQRERGNEECACRGGPGGYRWTGLAAMRGA